MCAELTRIASYPVEDVISYTGEHLALDLVEIRDPAVVHKLHRQRTLPYGDDMSHGKPYHEFAIRPRVTIIQTESPGGGSTNMGTTARRMSSADAES